MSIVSHTFNGLKTLGPFLSKLEKCSNLLQKKYKITGDQLLSFGSKVDGQRFPAFKKIYICTSDGFANILTIRMNKINSTKD